jgi:succinoglycan biosynthesis protein ExoM
MGLLPPPEISITISTFRRPSGLRRLLDGIRGLDPSSPRFDVVVVDNDVNESGRPVVDGEGSTSFDLRYFVEPVQSIARARNRGVGEASGRFIAFIDDDEWPDPAWLVELWTLAQQTRADAVIGPVLAVLPESTPRWLAAGGFFQRKMLETGRPVEWWDATTANALVRRDSMLSLPALFDDALGLAGGSDSDLFRRMLARGLRVVGSRTGTVHEAIDPSRVNAAWLLKRHFRNGMTSARLSRRKRRARRLVKHGAAALLSLGRGRVEAFRQLLAAAAALGEMATATGYRYEPYRDSKRARSRASGIADAAPGGASRGA